MSRAGGYDYNFSEQFVNTPLDRYFCVICQHPSRDPRMSVCCGHVFCNSCIENVKSPCPMCRDENFVTFPNKQLDREIKNLDIFCTNISRGCMWQGKLSNIDDHLGRHGDCQFEEVKCTNDCGKRIQRWYLTAHIETKCPRRQVTCQYCHDIGEHQHIEGKQHKEQCPRFPIPCPNNCKVKTVPREDMTKHRGECQLELVSCPNNCGGKLKRQCLVTHIQTRCICRKVKCRYCHDPVEYQFIENQHKEECPKLPLLCPNKCKIGAVHREDMEAHKKECPLEMIQCEYHSVGCDTRMLRMNKQVHEEENMKEHLMLTKVRLDSTEDKLVDAMQQVDALKASIHLSVQWMIKLITMATLFESGDRVCPVITKMTGFNKKVKDADVCYTNSFYTYNKGYKVCARVDPAGYDDAKETHLSMFVYVVRGRHDDELTWPLKGTFDIKLLNQLSDSEHLSVTITFDDSTKRHGGRVVVGDVADNGWGQRYQLISNEDLYKTTPTCQFLKDDCVYFELDFSHA